MATTKQKARAVVVLEGLAFDVSATDGTPHPRPRLPTVRTTSGSPDTCGVRSDARCCASRAGPRRARP